MKHLCISINQYLQHFQVNITDWLEGKRRKHAFKYRLANWLTGKHCHHYSKVQTFEWGISETLYLVAKACRRCHFIWSERLISSPFHVFLASKMKNNSSYTPTHPQPPFCSMLWSPIIFNSQFPVSLPGMKSTNPLGKHKSCFNQLHFFFWGIAIRTTPHYVSVLLVVLNWLKTCVVVVPLWFSITAEQIGKALLRKKEVYKYKNSIYLCCWQLVRPPCIPPQSHHCRLNQTPKRL